MGQGSQAVNTFYCVCVCMDMTKKSTHEELTSCCWFFLKKKATTKNINKRLPIAKRTDLYMVLARYP